MVLDMKSLDGMIEHGHGWGISWDNDSNHKISSRDQRKVLQPLSALVRPPDHLLFCFSTHRHIGREHTFASRPCLYFCFFRRPHEIRGGRLGYLIPTIAIYKQRFGLLGLNWQDVRGACMLFMYVFMYVCVCVCVCVYMYWVLLGGMEDGVWGMGCVWFS